MSETSLRQEALLNEYKGNLFEFLYARAFASMGELEDEFLLSLTESDLQILNQQEQFLRQYYSFLLKELPRLAMDAVKKTVDVCHITPGNILRVEFIGKLASAKKDSGFEEADILLYMEKKSPLLISLKMSKKGAFVNTKSAGIKTFLMKYFFVEDALQNEFNYFIDTEFETLAIELHSMVGIDYAKGFTEWEKAGFPVLPGDLKGDEKKALLNYYSAINNKLYEILLRLLNADGDQFLRSLLPLMGFSNNEIIQVTAFYQTKNDKLENSYISIHRNDQKLSIQSIEKKSNNIELDLGHLLLQIRTKPMNKFTSKAYKVNCSVKYKT